MFQFLPALAPELYAAGFCLTGAADLVWLHLLSDLAIGVAYLSIPATLALLLMRRRDVAYPWLLGLFVAFIASCGLTHLMHASAFVAPMPEVAGLAKAFTAAISVATAIVLWPVLPRLLAMPSPAALAREVEERRAAEARAQASEARNAALLANMAEAVFVLRLEADGGFTLESANPAFERIFGLKLSEVVGQRAEAALPAALLGLGLPHWRACAGGGLNCTYELEAETPAGRRAWQTALVPLRDETGRVARLLGSARDVTATRRLQAGLVQSARLATVGTMCAGLAHETSQPLNAALLWLRTARAEAARLPAEAAVKLARALGVVEGQLRRTGELVGRIRALAGATDAEAAVFDASQAVAAAVRTAGGQYAPEGIELAFDPAREALPVRGAPARLEQAVLQLLANARDAVAERRAAEPEAPARIAVALRREAGQVVVEVRDSGPGVPEAIREAMFDPFFTTKDPGRGIGLGLPLAAGVARGMGGGIESWNLAGGGACFRMALAPAGVPAVAA